VTVSATPSLITLTAPLASEVITIPASVSAMRSVHRLLRGI
jgi:hypothetical protein